ncbi:MAG: hypothetical protein HYZ42_02420, partial [Bacteroidetes bacterium]|nr:hypothetical protein [Bacteroidota bacterium]
MVLFLNPNYATMYFKKLLLLLSGIFFCCYAKSQDGSLQLYQNGYYIKQYSEISGLVYNSCRFIYQDSRGFLWIGTSKGLSRFDGKQFTNYGIREGLPGTDITQVSEDSLGFMYVATTRGVARYTGRNKGNDSCFYTYDQTTHLTSLI